MFQGKKGPINQRTRATPTTLLSHPHHPQPATAPFTQKEAVNSASLNTHLLWDQEIPFPAGLTELQEHTEVDIGFLAPPPSLPTKASPTHKLPQIKEIPRFPSGVPPIWEVRRLRGNTMTTRWRCEPGS